MKYSPTPRDLFNPPPQAEQDEGRAGYFDYLRGLVFEVYPDFYDENQRLLEGVVNTLEEHENLIKGA